MNAIALWITGLPGSGKSTVAEGIKQLHPEVIILRSDELRKIVTPEPTYSEAERDIVYRSLVYTAYALVNNGHDVIIDATGNLRGWRDLARKLIPGYGEIYLKCPLEVCKTRESGRIDTLGAPEGIYRKGAEGWPVPGVKVPYEEPVNPELLIEVDRTSVRDTVVMVEGLFMRMKEESV